MKPKPKTSPQKLAYMQAYVLRPGVKTKRQQNGNNWRQKPENAVKSKAYMQEYNSRPEVKERRELENIARRGKPRAPYRLAYALWHASKTRAKRRKRPHTITSSDVEIMLKNTASCRYCNEILKSCTSHPPTLDEIVVGFGYIAGNVDIICRSCNSQKQNTPPARLLEFADRIKEVQEKLESQL